MTQINNHLLRLHFLKIFKKKVKDFMRLIVYLTFLFLRLIMLNESQKLILYVSTKIKI